MFHFLTVIRALSDENRLRALMALREREMCVCQITALLDLAPSTTSKHLTILRQARLIEGRKKGKWVYYTLATGPGSSEPIREALAWVTKALSDNPQIQKDHSRLAQVLILHTGCEPGDESIESEEHSRAIHLLTRETGGEEEA